MPTAVVKPKTKAVPAETAPKIVTAEQRTRIKQERAKLQQELEFCEENFELAKAELERAADPSLDPDIYVMAHRDYTIVHKKLIAKQSEIAKHRQTFLSDEEIAARDKEEQEAKEFAAREERRLKIARPWAEQLQQAVSNILAADKLFNTLLPLIDSGQVEFNGGYQVRELCHSALRNFRTQDPRYKVWMEGGAGADAMQAIAKKAAQ
jgi:hypothetical protein